MYANLIWMDNLHVIHKSVDRELLKLWVCPGVWAPRDHLWQIDLLKHAGKHPFCGITPLSLILSNYPFLFLSICEYCLQFVY